MSREKFSLIDHAQHGDVLRVGRQRVGGHDPAALAQQMREPARSIASGSAARSATTGNSEPSVTSSSPSMLGQLRGERLGVREHVRDDLARSRACPRRRNAKYCRITEVEGREKFSE